MRNVSLYPYPSSCCSGRSSRATLGKEVKSNDSPHSVLLCICQRGRVHGCKSPLRAPASLRLPPRLVVASKALPEPDAPPTVPWHWLSSPPIPPDKGFGSEHPGRGLILSPCRDHPDFLFTLVQNSPPLWWAHHRESTFLSSRFLPQISLHNFMTAEYKKYLLKVIFFPLEGLKDLGMMGKQNPCFSLLPGVLGVVLILLQSPLE